MRLSPNNGRHDSTAPLLPLFRPPWFWPSPRVRINTRPVLVSSHLLKSASSSASAFISLYAPARPPLQDHQDFEATPRRPFVRSFLLLPSFFLFTPATPLHVSWPCCPPRRHNEKHAHHASVKLRFCASALLPLCLISISTTQLPRLVCHLQLAYNVTYAQCRQHTAYCSFLRPSPSPRGGRDVPSLGHAAGLLSPIVLSDTHKEVRPGVLYDNHNNPRIPCSAERPSYPHLWPTGSSSRTCAPSKVYCLATDETLCQFTRSLGFEFPTT